MEFSDEQLSLVANVWNLPTGFVSPQYHVVFGDFFQVMFISGDDDTLVDFICNNYFTKIRKMSLFPLENLLLSNTIRQTLVG